MLPIRQILKDRRFPGKTAQRLELSPAGFNLAVHIAGGHNLEHQGLRIGADPATVNQQPGNQQRKEPE